MSRRNISGNSPWEPIVGYRPVATMVEVSRLIDPDMLVEIEAEAILPTA